MAGHCLPGNQTGSQKKLGAFAKMAEKDKSAPIHFKHEQNEVKARYTRIVLKGFNTHLITFVTDLLGWCVIPQSKALSLVFKLGLKH